ncbi:hypothetical protein M408DRAFT_262711 [Serendipita vermifera MAFF 305830]|uniref:Uncharacterized protein n=1 Tax=Serendipita vermifera MAFF 305830 TaxID=933852 RepID=A0A0C3AW52_SERVB|nr:hypothetical protein M408DRAFT_262711 [Serendipita vermifera MAFF 305830]
MWIEKGRILNTLAFKMSHRLIWDATSTSESHLIRSLRDREIDVFAWGGNDIPEWCKDEHGGVLPGMKYIVTLRANLSSLAQSLRIQHGPKGNQFYQLDYDVFIHFDGKELRARLQWNENGVLWEGPAKVIPSWS